jgi:hypothetical protein
MTLELKHLVPYFPYKLRMIFEGKGGRIIEVTGLRLAGLSEETQKLIYFSSVSETLSIQYFKPILRPLCDLNSEIKFNNRKFYPIDELAEIDEVVVLQYSFEFFETSMKYLPNWIVEKLLEWHFDIFGLIEQGLAVSIHDVGEVIT